VDRAWHRLLEEVRERPVPDVMEERGGQRVPRSLARDPLPKWEIAVDLAEAREEELHHVGGADRVGEARVLGARKGERREAELPDPAEALDLRGGEEAREDLLLIALERDESVDRVSENHGALLVAWSYRCYPT
jgi:hypothetical protein